MATETRTKEYVRPITVSWWFTHPARATFMVRELSSFFIAAYCIFLIVLLYRAEHSDPVPFRAFYERLGQPASIGLHLIALLFAVFHSITFFNLTPRVFVVHRGEERIPDAVIAGAHFGAWLVVSIVVLVLVLVV